ncbi:hypothetical protein SOVF_020040 isoform B [Spinacia oleracea]|nr:hypothetical protein SOVF_020040 isoform B [Spinacia oleracea]
MVLDVDLNVPPANFGEVGTSSHVAPVVAPVQAEQQRSVPQVVPIDVDSLDDDVVLCSPRAFAEAKNNSRRNQTRTNVVDIDRESSTRNAANQRNKRQRISTTLPIINCESYVISQAMIPSVKVLTKTMFKTLLSESLWKGFLDKRMSGFPAQKRSVVPQPPPPPPEPTFSCPVCISPLVEEVTTKCGHIFCRACIKKAISSQGKCPTCRRKVTLKDTIRIYLPTTR